MKRCFVLILAFLVLIGLAGCTLKIYKLPEDGFCYTAYEKVEIELSKEAQEYVINLLNNGKWYFDLIKCPADVNFYTKGITLGYCAESGAFNDFTLRRSLVISETERIILNDYLGLN